MFGTEMGTQISWLLPSALVAIGALGWLTHGRPRTDALRASLVLWGGWLLVTGAVLSMASGIIHPYYTVALAPAIAALVGIAAVHLWRHRDTESARWVLAALVASATVWTFVLLGRTSWHPELRWVVVLSGAGAVAAVLSTRMRAVVVAPLVAIALLVAPTAYSLQTAASAHSGAIPTAGPGTTGFGGAGRGARAGGPPGAGTRPAGGFGAPQGAVGGAQPGGRAGGAPGGLGGTSTVNAALEAALSANAGSYRWIAATTGDNEAASLELATGDSVMSLGGYNGTDPAIALAAFKQLVAVGKIHYYVGDAQGFIGSTAANTSTAYQIQQWVTSTFTATTVGGTTIYDLTAGR
jgi:4-amino-4-deoxy-L-arabinose transferase-like glycosyltransferase